MGLLSFLKRQPEDDQPSARPLSADEVQRARTRARRRLVGAVVLLGVGIIGFPLVFETRPRPIPVDLPIEIPRKESVPPLAVPPPKATGTRASGPVTVEAPADAGAAKSPAPPPTAAAASMPAPDAAQRTGPARPAPAPVAAAREPAAPPAAEPRPPKPVDTTVAEAARAKALLEGGQAGEAAGGRFVVQVGAFSDPAMARDMRSKVEKLGLTTYTQAVDTAAGKRIRVRVGPFASRDEADKAAARIKSAGFGQQVLAL
jgi:DedD protein